MYVTDQILAIWPSGNSQLVAFEAVQLVKWHGGLDHWANSLAIQQRGPPRLLRPDMSGSTVRGSAVASVVLPIELPAIKIESGAASLAALMVLLKKSTPEMAHLGGSFKEVGAAGALWPRPRRAHAASCRAWHRARCRDAMLSAGRLGRLRYGWKVGRRCGVISCL